MLWEPKAQLDRGPERLPTKEGALAPDQATPKAPAGDADEDWHPTIMCPSI